LHSTGMHTSAASSDFRPAAGLSFPESEMLEWQNRLEVFISSSKARDASHLGPCLRRCHRLASPPEQRHFVTAMLKRDEPHVRGLAFILHHETLGSQPLRASASIAEISTRVAQFSIEFRSGPLIKGLFESTPSHFKGDLYCLASAGCDSQAAELVLEELGVNGLHADLCARTLLSEALETETTIGPRRSFNALVLAAALASPTCGRHRELLVATIVQLCAPLSDEASQQTLLRAVEGACSSVRREFDRLIMSSADRRVRERLIPMLSTAAFRRPARACLESCAPNVLESACGHAAHRLWVDDRMSLLETSAIALQFTTALRTLVHYSEKAYSVLSTCLVNSTLDEPELVAALAVAARSDSAMLRWKSELALLRCAPSAERDQALAALPLTDSCRTETTAPRSTAAQALERFGTELTERPIWWLGARARLLLDRHPDAFHALLRRYLIDRTGPALLPLLQLIRRLRLSAELEPELLELAESGNPVLTGSHRKELVHLLASTRSSRGAAYILRCTVDADVRVQEAVFSVLAGPDGECLGAKIMVPDLLKRIACTAETAVRKAALKALRARSRSAFEELMDTLFEGEWKASPHLLLDAALYCERPIVSSVLRLLEQTEDESCSTSGAVVLRTLQAQRGPWVERPFEQVAV